MRKSAVLMLALGLAAVAGALLLFLARPAPGPDSATATPTSPSPTPAVATGTTPAPAPLPATPPIATTTAPATANLPVWEQRIDDILRSNMTEVQVSQLLLNLLPTLPKEGQIQAASHVANLLADENYAQALPVLTNPNTPPEVLSILMTDLMNRPDPVKLRGWLAVARQPGHPLAEEALSALVIYLDDDFGADWNRWAGAVDAYIQRQQAGGQVLGSPPQTPPPQRPQPQPAQGQPPAP